MARLFDQVLPLSQVSLQPPASFPELYQELWWYSGGSGQSGTNITSAGSRWLVKGGVNTATATPLITFGSNWNASTKCALEVSLWVSGGGYVGYAALWDVTSNSIVSASQVSSTSTTATVVRSGQLTLNPGHQYGVTTWVTGGTTQGTYLTDASLIIFPPAGSVSPSLSSISLANPSGGSLKEAYIPLWVYSSGSVTVVNNTSGTIGKGSTNLGAGTGNLYTLNSSWSNTQKFAFETSLWVNNSASTVSAQLWDITSAVAVSSSTLSTTSTTATLLRSGQFTLTPGHSYGVKLSLTGANSGYLTKAHLVALGG